MRAELREKRPDFKVNLTKVIVDVLGTEGASYHPDRKKCYKKNVSERAAQYYLVA